MLHIRATRLLAGGALAASAVLTATGNATAAPAAPGLSHQQLRTLSARFWQWGFGLPVHTNGVITHPLFTTGKTDCSLGQTGKVWFLGSSVNSPATSISRTCTVPTGVTLFVPVYNGWYDNSNCDGSPPTTYTTAQLRALVKASIDAVTGLRASLDGRSVLHLSTARYISPVFSYTTPADSVLNDYICGPPNSYRPQTVPGAVAEGIYVTVGPLSAGAHTLRWHVQKRDGSAQQDVTYQLTVP